MQEKKIRKKRIIQPTFLSQLHSILQNPSYANIIHWNDEGDSFVIYQKDSLINEVLPKVYRHKKITSFLRQLNFYGFKRKCAENNLLNYYHPEFKRDEANFQIKKKVSTRSIINDQSQIKQIQQELNQIKLQQIQMKSQIQQCSMGFTEISCAISNLLNALFLHKINNVMQSKGFLVTILKLIFGMKKEKKTLYEQLLKIIFQQGEVEKQEPDKCLHSNYSEFSPLPILQYMFSSCPATPVQQTSELLNILDKMAQENQE